MKNFDGRNEQLPKKVSYHKIVITIADKLLFVTQHLHYYHHKLFLSHLKYDQSLLKELKNKQNANPKFGKLYSKLFNCSK